MLTRKSVTLVSLSPNALRLSLGEKGEPERQVFSTSVLGRVLAARVTPTAVTRLAIAFRYGYSAASFEELDGAFVLLRCSARFECSKILASARLRVLLT